MTTADVNRVADVDVREITDWLYREAELLDNGQFREWLELLAPELHYVVPLRVTREKEAGTDIVSNMTHMDDDRTSMEMRVIRIETGFAWAEDPPSKARRFITNPRIRPGNAENEFDVVTNMLLYRTRSDIASYDVLSGERRDVLRRTDTGFQLVNRVVLLDQTTLLTHNLALIM